VVKASGGQGSYGYGEAGRPLRGSPKRRSRPSANPVGCRAHKRCDGRRMDSELRRAAEAGAATMMLVPRASSERGGEGETKGENKRRRRRAAGRGEGYIL
jgi:hypothetical protein